jgi:NurA domain
VLDFNQLARQMQGISQHLVNESAAMRQKLDYAEILMAQAQPIQADLMDRQEHWRDRLLFASAIPIEPLETRKSIAPPPAAHTVLATDGSQIAPSHHEIAYCYLINTGRIVLHYGQGKQPLLDSLPEVFYRPEDLFVSRQWGIKTEEWMSYRRTITEIEILAELAQYHQTQQLPKPTYRSFADLPTHNEQPAHNAQFTIHSSPLARQARSSEQLSLLPEPESRPQPKPLNLPENAAPTIAMVDGSLIYWFLEPLPSEAREQILQPILAAWRSLQRSRVPMVGYISASRSGESLNFLRFQSCPYTSPDCMSHCSNLPDKAPCQVLEPLRDSALWGRLLKPGERSPLWKSSAKIQSFYEEQCIYFCYVHVGSEVARVEVPEWVAADDTMLASALSLVLGQVKKGYGYPVALAEAHNQAVVRGGDRSRFFALLEQQMIRAGIRNVGTSYKEARKRGSIA